MFASHLQGAALVHAPAGLADLAADLGGAREGDPRDIGMIDHHLTGGPAGSVDELQAAGRHARLKQGLDKQVGRVRNDGRRLEHDGVSAQQRREDLPARNRHREVEGGDHTEDADRAAVAHRPLVAQLRRNRVPEQAAALARRVVGGVDRLRQQVARVTQDLAALGGRHRPPLQEALQGGGHGPLDVILPREREMPDQVRHAGRIPVLVGFARARLAPLAIYEVQKARRFTFRAPLSGRTSSRVFRVAHRMRLV
jgi:hypothetical protein